MCNGVTGEIEYTYPNVRAQSMCVINGTPKAVGMLVANELVPLQGNDDIQQQLAVAEEQIGDMEDFDIPVQDVQSSIDAVDDLQALADQAGLSGENALSDLCQPRLYPADHTQRPYRSALRLLGFTVPLEEPGNASVTVQSTSETPLVA